MRLPAGALTVSQATAKAEEGGRMNCQIVAKDRALGPLQCHA